MEQEFDNENLTETQKMMNAKRIDLTRMGIDDQD